MLTVLAELGNLALRISRRECWPGIRVSSLGRGIRFVHQLQNPRTVLDLIARVQVCVVERAGLPHLPNDFQPTLAQGAQGAGMALALGSKRLVIGLRPRTELPAQVGPEMHDVAQ